MRLNVLAVVGLVSLLSAPHPRRPPSSERYPAMSHRITGPFEVTVKPLEPYNQDPGADLARMSLDKQFHGSLEATGKGEMLSAGSPSGSGGYVAIERVTGALEGRHGSFALQHKGIMHAGTPTLDIIVVPGSGTGELEGLSGRLAIHVGPAGEHRYEFEYELTPAAR